MIFTDINEPGTFEYKFLLHGFTRRCGLKNKIMFK